MSSMKRLVEYILVLKLVFLAPLLADTQSLETQAQNLQEQATAAKNSVFKITDYGISPNTSSDAVPAILKAAQAAITYVQSTNQPAKIVIPTGKYWISQFTLHGLNNITLQFAKNAQVYAFPKSSLIDASNPYLLFDSCTNFVILGKPGSLLDGNGASWWSDPNGNSPKFIYFTNCQNYQMHGLTVQNSPFHTITLAECTNGIIHDLSILAPADSPNTDGIDTWGNVNGLEIYNCNVSNGDDGFALNTQDGPINNIYIHDCVLTNGHGMSIGSLVNYDVTNVKIENLTIDGAWYAIRLKFRYSTKTAHLQNISYTNINSKNLTRGAIAIIPDYDGKIDPNFTLDNISINNFTCVGAPIGLSLALGNKKQAITPVVLNHVSITGTTKPDQIKNCPVQVIN